MLSKRILVVGWLLFELIVPIEEPMRIPTTIRIAIFFIFVVYPLIITLYYRFDSN